jgi:nucleoside 2-deoxyribosyltransferase-like protein/pfkB family carbohydrate kinase
VITVVGGCYHEVCLSPSTRQFYGSGGRAAAALSSVCPTQLYTYSSVVGERHVRRLASLSNFDVHITRAPDEITFAYVNSLFAPVANPPLPAIKRANRITTTEENVLLFGMVEGCGRVTARNVIYDPQSGASPVSFGDTGSTAEHLAVVCNVGEAVRLAGSSEADAAKLILLKEKAEVVVVKGGPNGARVITKTGEDLHIPAYFSESVFSIGSGDIFAAAFAYAWVVKGLSAAPAADFASRAVCHYVQTCQDSLATDYNQQRAFTPVTVQPGTVYLAGPFFNMTQRWLIEETRSLFRRFKLEVFSPLHDVGFGEAVEVATGDLQGLERCDRLFAVLDGLDAGTIFEIGYARKMGIPVYAYSETTSSEDCLMFELHPVPKTPS